AKRESIEAILDMAEHKKFGAARKLVVAGCLVERYRHEILQEIPEVDFVIGTNELERVLEACALDDAPPAGGKDAGGPTGVSGRNQSQARRTFDFPAAPYLYHEFTPRVLSTPGYSAYLKIAEGCDHPCTFCVIPQMRGRFRSRRFESVVREAENLARQGVRELTLIGQDTTSYGHDLGLHDGLATLLRELGKCEGLVWLRFLYCYPNQLTESLIAAVAETPTAAKYFDIPLQHASGPVLKAMRRGSNGGQFLKMLEKIRRAMPEAALRTSMIVGFPGETDDDFKALTDFVAAAEFDHLGVFLYSNEETSASFGLENQVAARVAVGRQKRLLALQRRISRGKLRRRIGRRYPVLVEGRSEETNLLFRGRLESQAPEIDGRVLINDFEGPEPQPGEFRWATVTAASDYDLVARLEAQRFAEDVPTDRSTAAPREIPAPQPSGACSVALGPGPRLVNIQAVPGAPS
ncbi:MAG TPA: 30S ribosomal protein S12 methylthiotransferase RimO, partial [Terriglobia bacterium]|nr:30S ribosomal protein S12 methylthiotransferase RimO [Terriglobia bacterium]